MYYEQREGDDDGFTQFESKFTRNSLGEPDSVTLGPLTMKYVYDSHDGLLCGPFEYERYEPLSIRHHSCVNDQVLNIVRLPIHR